MKLILCNKIGFVVFLMLISAFLVIHGWEKMKLFGVVWENSENHCSKRFFNK